MYNYSYLHSPRDFSLCNKTSNRLLHSHSSTAAQSLSYEHLPTREENSPFTWSWISESTDDTLHREQALVYSTRFGTRPIRGTANTFLLVSTVKQSTVNRSCILTRAFVWCSNPCTVRTLFGDESIGCVTFAYHCRASIKGTTALYFPQVVMMA